MICVDAILMIAEEIREGLELKRTDRDIAERIARLLTDHGYAEVTV